MGSNFVPCFSHGGSSGQGWTAVVGNTTNSGNPIDIGGSAAEPANWPVLLIFVTAGGSATVVIEANGGELDSTSNPPAGEWVDISNGGIALAGATIQAAKRIPPNVPYVRTRIAAVGGGGVVTSYIPAICYPGGKWTSPSHPSKSSFHQS